MQDALESPHRPAASAPHIPAPSVPPTRTAGLARSYSTPCPPEQYLPSEPGCGPRCSEAPRAKAYESPSSAERACEQAPAPRSRTQPDIPTAPAPAMAASRPSILQPSSCLPPLPSRRCSMATRDLAIQNLQLPAPAPGLGRPPRPWRQSSLAGLYGADGLAYSHGARDQREIRPEPPLGTPALGSGTIGPTNGSVGSGSVASDAASTGVFTPPSSDSLAHRQRSYRLPSPLSLPCAATPLASRSASSAPGASWTKSSLPTNNVQPDPSITSASNHIHYPPCRKAHGDRPLPGSDPGAGLGPGPGPDPSAGPDPRGSPMSSLPLLPPIRPTLQPLRPSLPADRQPASRPATRGAEHDAHLLMHLRRPPPPPPRAHMPQPAAFCKHDRAYDCDYNRSHNHDYDCDLQREHGEWKRIRIKAHW